MDRPMVNAYETDGDGVEQLVYREMNDEEYEVWQRDQVSAEEAAKAESIHPLVAQVQSMSDAERAQLLELLG